MVDVPAFRKLDRYKASSYRSYNYRMPSRYDTSIWMDLCQVPLWDRTVVQELGPSIGSLRILDVGCATGRLLQRLAEAGATELFGIDLAPRILDVARAKLSKSGTRVELRDADAEDSLPWQADSFDAVTMTGVLHHFFRPRQALAEVRRVLRPGGRLVLIDPCFFPPLRQVVNTVLRVSPHQGDFHFYSRSAAGRLLQSAGFALRNSRRVGCWAFLANVLKPDPQAPANRCIEQPARQRAVNPGT